MKSISKHGKPVRLAPLQVVQERCNQCLFSPDKIVSDERRKEILDSCMKRGAETFFICHKTKRACCRGFYDSGYGQRVAVIQVADRLGLVEFVTEDTAAKS